MQRLGVIGTLVRDRIHGPRPGAEPVERWGGITYSLAAFIAALPERWELLPMIKIGRDVEAEARALLGGLGVPASGPGLRIAPEPNNRVELHYRDAERRVEHLEGGVPGWCADELLPLIGGLDALYLNFISGFETDLDTATRVRRNFSGPIYADLHSLFLGVGPDGRRVPRSLPDSGSWLRCFDIVQVNEDELTRLAGGAEDPWRFAEGAVGDAPRILLVTLGSRGAVVVDGRESAGDDAVRRVPSERARTGDPTGCGDVWGATCFARMLAGDVPTVAAGAANDTASASMDRRGAENLASFLAAGPR